MPICFSGTKEKKGKNIMAPAILSGARQLAWKIELARRLQKENYGQDNIRKILNFIRYYVSFRDVPASEILDQQIQSTFQQRKNMGIGGRSCKK